jgi:hypothetical protein
VAYRVSARATLLRPEQLRLLAAGDARLRGALERTLRLHRACDACDHALLADPWALCPGCPLPEGGAAVLLALDHGDGGDVELAAWTAAEGLEAPALVRLGRGGACGGDSDTECSVALVVEDAGGAEVARHESVLLLAPFDGGSVWAAGP